MTRDEQYIIENAAAGDDLDLLLATHRCADCGADAFLDVASVWLCVECAPAALSEPALSEPARSEPHRGILARHAA
jgi:hypothetical protein